MSVTELAIKRPILFIVFFLVLGGAGMFAFSRLGYELLPNLATPFVTVSTIYPGASPTEVENSVTNKIEESVGNVGKVKKVNSASYENLSVVSIEFLADANADDATQQVQRAVSKVLPDLPNGVKSPSIEKFNINDLPVLRIGVTANINETELYDLLNDQIKPRLAQLKNVGRITLLGGSEKEVKVQLQSSKLNAYNIQVYDVAEAIRKQNLDYPVGNIKDADLAFSVRLSGKMEDLSVVEYIPIKVLSDGSKILLKDVGLVQSSVKDIEVINRVNNEASIGLFVNKQSGANAVEVANKVKDEIKRIESDFKNLKLTFEIAQDTSEFTVHAANAVYEDFGIAILLVALVMLVFLHSLRNAAIIMVAIPTSLFSAFILMYLLGFTLNLMTLLAMSLVIGILVDDSIVVLENIYRHLEMGKPKEEASLDGRNEIGFAALSITLVDIVVFLPMALVPGLVGSLIKQFSLVIVVSTLSSLIVSFTLTPMIASRFAKLEHINANTFGGKIATYFERLIDNLTTLYESILRWSLSHKLITLGIAISLLASSILLVVKGFVGSEFLPATDKGEVSLILSMQPGTKFNTTNDAVQQVETKLKTIKEITKTFVNVGFTSEGFGENFSSHIASINIALVPSNQRKKSLQVLSKEIKAIAMQVPGIKARVIPIGLFGTNDAPIQISISGTKRENVFNDAQNILDSLRTIKGITGLRASTEKGKPEMEISIDKLKAAELGIDPEAIAINLRGAVNGYNELKFKNKNKDVAVRIAFAEEDRNTTEALNNYSFLNSKGQPVYLNQFALVKPTSGPTVLERVNKQASIMLLAQVLGRPSGDIGDDIKAKLKNYKLQEGVHISYEGDLALQDDSFNNLGIALLTSFILIYLIMVVLYNNWVYPFVILFSIPVALIGALLALALTGKSLNIFSIFGLIMMMGLVAKNAILVVDRTIENIKNKQLNYSLTEALVEAGTTRLRPILMTTLAMVIGMLPLAIAKGAGAELNSGLAWVLIGGLTSSMFLTLVVVPIVYYLVTKILNKASTINKSQIKNKGLLIILFIIGSQISLQAQSFKISLKEAENLAVTQNRQLKAAELELVKSTLNVKEATGNLLPSLNATGNYINNIKAPVFFFPSIGVNQSTGSLIIDEKNLQPVTAASNNVFNGTVNLNVPIFNSEISKAIALAKANKKISESNLLITQRQIVEEVRKSYYNTLLASSNIDLIEQSIIRANLNLDLARSLYKQGFSTQVDTLNAFVNLQSLIVNRIKVKNALITSKNYLRYLLNVNENADVEPLDSLNDFTLVNTLKDFQKPEMKLNEYQINAAVANINLEKSKYLPSVSFINQYTIQSQANDLSFSKYIWPNSFYTGIQLNIPIFNGFKTQARIQQAQITLKQLKLQKENLTEQFKLENNAALSALNEAKEVYRVTLLSINAAEQSLILIKNRWSQGIAKFSEVSDAEVNYIQSKSNLFQSAYNFQLAKINYLKSIGQ